MHYILKDKKPVPIADLLEWAKAFGAMAGRRVAEDFVRREKGNIVGKIHVSTVFLGIDHQWGDGPPLLFETMVFGDCALDESQERYSTWEEAEAGHRAWVERVKTCVQPEENQ